MKKSHKEKQEQENRKGVTYRKRVTVTRRGRTFSSKRNRYEQDKGHQNRKIWVLLGGGGVAKRERNPLRFVGCFIIWENEGVPPSRNSEFFNLGKF